MRAVVRIHRNRSGRSSSAQSASSSLSHYVAWDGARPEREGAGPRPLFTNDGRDELTYYGADRYLAGGRGSPDKGDLIHFSVSFLPGDFEALGATREERLERLREVAREAMEDFKSDLREAHHKLRGYKHNRKRRDSHLEWRWVAGVHLNTDNPHIHFLIHKDLVEKGGAGGSGKILRVGRVPKEMLPPGRKIRGASPRPVEGIIGRRFVAALDRARDRAREALVERSVLGMDQSSSLYDLKFESALVDRDVEHWTIETYCQARKLSDGDLDLRRWIASLPPEEARRVGRRLDRMRELALEEARLSESGEALSPGIAERRSDIARERRTILDAFPEEVRARAARARAREDWPEIRAGVLWTSLRHGFGPGTEARKLLLSTGARELSDGDRDNLIGRFLMRIRGEAKRREDYIAELEKRVAQEESKAQVVPSRHDENDSLARRYRSLDGVLLELMKRNEAPVDRARVENFIADILCELTKRNPSLAGRELTREIIERGPAPEPGRPPDVLGDRREAFKERQLDDAEYVPRHIWGDRLRKEHSQELAWLYETGAQIKDGVVIFPAEGHELNGLTGSRDPFITELRYALDAIDDREKALEFYDLARKIAGRTADGKAQFGYFKYFYDRLKQGPDGRYLSHKDKEGRRRALERTLEEMRPLAAEMEAQEPRQDGPEMRSLEEVESDEVERQLRAAAPQTVAAGLGGRKAIDESFAPSLFDQEVDERERMIRGQPKGADTIESEVALGGIEEGGESLAEPDDVARSEGQEEDESEAAGAFALGDGNGGVRFEDRSGSFVFNTAARMFNLRNEGPRFPAGLTYEERKSLVEVHLPNIDAKIEAGMRPDLILRDVGRMVLNWNDNLTEEGAERQELQEKNNRIGSFLRAYVEKRLEDPETRALNSSEAFRDAHARILATRSPEELIRAMDRARKSPLNEKERRLLFNGRAPDHHTSEMREIRLAGWLTLDERVRLLSEGRLPMSRELKELLAELDSRDSEGRVDYFVRALKTPPDRLQKPEESLRLGLWEKRERLPEHEIRFLFNETWEKKRSFADRRSSLRETSLQPGNSRPSERLASRDNESARVYREGVEIEKRRLGEEIRNRRGGLPLSQQELDEIHERAVKLAFERLVPKELFEGPLEGAKKELSDVIARLQEETQPRLRVATRALEEFYQEKIGAARPSEPAHREALSKLGPEDERRRRELLDYVSSLRAAVSAGFEEIDRLRRELSPGRGDSVTEKASPVAVETGDRAVTADPRSLARPPLGAESRIDSYREYLGYVREIEQKLISEALRRRADARGNGVEQAAPLLTLEEKREIRARAGDLALERFERPVYANEPKAPKLLPLSEAIRDAIERLKRMRARTQEAARELDDFIRANLLPNIDPKQLETAKIGDGLYYGAGKIPEATRKLTPEGRTEFERLKANASQTLADFRNGFREIDRLRPSLARIERAQAVSNGVGSRDPRPGDGPRGGAPKGALPGERDASIKEASRGRDSVLDRERMNDRRILGDAIIKRAQADCAALDYEIARDNGGAFRFSVRDESMDADRRISSLDVHRRAGARGDRAADELGARRSDNRAAIRGQAYEEDIRHHSTTLDEHGKKLGRLVSELESKAEKALDAYRHAERIAGEVTEKYQKRGEPLPAPFVRREDLARTQDEVIKRGFAGHAEALESLRAALAEETGRPMRSDQEAARLAAQVFVAAAELKARQERAVRFDETRHLRRWEIGGGKFSLADVDRRLERLSDEAAVVGRHELHLDPAARKAASAEIERLGEIRKEIIDKIVRQQGETRQRVDEAGKLFETLARAHSREAALRERSGLQMPAPQFTREELERAADNVEIARDATLLRELSAFERRFNAYADPKERFKPAEGWGRAPARAVVAEIFHRESSERLAAFEQRGEIQPLLIETPDGRLITHRLADTMPRSLLERIARPLIETGAQRESRHNVEQAFAHHEARLRADFEKTRSYLEAAREIASAQVAERSLRAGRESPAPEPALTPKQAMTVEIYAERQTDQNERERLLSLARGSALSHYESRSRADSSDRTEARPLAPAMGRGR